MNRPRYAYVRNPNHDHGQPHASYDIVDNAQGSERVMAYNVRFEPAVEIVDATQRAGETAQLFHYVSKTPGVSHA